jgi:LPXTG-site transpeptidase (sortase) family protein
MSRNEAIKFVVLRSLGNFLVLFSIYGVIATFGPLISAEAKYLLIQARGITFEVSGIKYQASRIQNTQYKIPNTKTVGFPELLSGSKEQIMIPIDPLFSILVPKLGANVRIFPNIDPDNPQAYLPILQQGVAHAKGSVFPGHPGTTYLFAHSADNWWDVGRYNAVFYTLNNLSEGDEIDIFFENRRYRYEVAQKVISDPQDTTYLTSQHIGSQRLVLQTCWPPGTTLKRLYVLAKPATSRD